MLHNEQRLLFLFRPIQQLFCEHERQPYLGDQQLVTKIQEYLSQGTITIHTGAEQNTYMQASTPQHRSIRINPSYTHLLCETSADVEIVRMKLFVIVRLIHELGYLFTNVFYANAGVDVDPNYVYDTPMKIGQKVLKNNKVKGDCGYGIEESLFGGRVFCHVVNSKHNYPFINSLRIEINNKQSYLKDSYVESTLQLLLKEVEILDADACKWKEDDSSPIDVELVVKPDATKKRKISSVDNLYNPSDKDEIEGSDEDSPNAPEEEQCWKD